MTASQFLAVFFGRAAQVVRDRYGDSSYIDLSGTDSVLIADSRGLLGAGLTLGDAIKEADRTIALRKGTGGELPSANGQASGNYLAKDLPTCSAPTHVSP